MSDQAGHIESIAIIGAGIIGLSCALDLADRGIAVSLYDKAWPPRGASWAAAGMLAPAFEAAAAPGVHPKLFELCDQSARMWPLWAEMLETRSGISAGYYPGPSLALATSDGQRARFESVRAAFSLRDDCPQDCSETYQSLEPAVAPDMRAAMLLPTDGQVDNRQTISALVSILERHDQVSIIIDEAPLMSDRGRLDHAGHDATLLCAGWGTAIVKVDEHGSRVSVVNWDTLLDEIDCYGGQMLSVGPVSGAPEMVVRSGHIYIVPKADRIIIGATTEPGVILESPEPEIIANLHAEAAKICPALAAAPVLQSWAGIRPGTKDHAPILGETRSPGLYVASGHFRNGILLAPLTAKIMADLISDGTMSDLAFAFSPQARLSAPV